MNFYGRDFLTLLDYTPEEINYLIGKSQEKGYTVVPLKAYISGRYVKIDIGLARGKHNYDKRQDLKKRDAQRDMQRALK